MRTGILPATLLALPLLASALPFRKSESVSKPVRRKAVNVPIKQWKRPGANLGLARRQSSDGTPAPAVGLGDLGDLIYAVSVNMGGTDVAVHMDTGSADLWVITESCQAGTCPGATGTAVPANTGASTGAQVTLNFGDSTTGTTASGPINQVDTVIAGLSLPQHPFAAVDFTNSTIVGPGVPTSGILGLAFPSGSQVQSSVVINELGNQLTIDKFLEDSATVGPLLSRLALSGQLEQPMFTITLQRDTVDVGGNHGALTLGDLPDGVDNSTLTWVPVRLYPQAQGGLPPPASAPDEIYPLRWEVVIDNVFFDGKKLPQPASSNGGPVSALIDSGNSLLRGPDDLVSEIFSTISPGSASSPNFPCSDAHTLEFEIGGQRFPIDPRDFVGVNTGEATTCDASRLVTTDPPNNSGRLFTWSLGDPFLKSNLVAFYFGNLTHPSVDPPRIGFLSTVPKDASTLLQQAVNDAQSNGGNFESSSDVAPTSTLPADATIVSGRETSTAVAATTTQTTAEATTTAETTQTQESTGAAATTSETTSEAAATTSTSETSSAAAETTSSTSSTAVVQTTSQAAPASPATTSTAADAGPVTVTSVHLSTAATTPTPATAANAAATPSPSNGALSGRAPVAWAALLGAVAVAVLGV